MSNLASQLPKSGGRVGLRLVEASDTSAVYALNLAHPEGQAEGVLEIAVEDGVVDLRLDTTAPQWLQDLARLLARTAWRNRQHQPWPRRITRWRPEPPRASS
jgi:hypothetical protein